MSYWSKKGNIATRVDLWQFQFLVLFAHRNSSKMENIQFNVTQNLKVDGYITSKSFSNLFIWDCWTATSEFWHSCSSHLAIHAHQITLCFRRTSKESYDLFKFWISTISPGTSVILVTSSSGLDFNSRRSIYNTHNTASHSFCKAS